MTQSATIEQPVQDQTIQIQELAIVLGAKNFKPTLLNPDALTVAGIIPGDWVLARQPVLSAQVGQLSFKNGVNIIAQGNTLTFSEGIRPGQEVQIPSVARQYVTKMNNADYRTVGISPKVLIGFSREEDTARKFIVEQLIAPGPWREIGTQAQAKVEFSYRLDRCFFNLSIVEARIAQAVLQFMGADIHAVDLPIFLFENGPRERAADKTVDAENENFKRHEV